MTKQELKQRLDDDGIDPESYSLDGGLNWYDRYCLDQREGRWFVYFAERGMRQDLKEFQTEHEACELLFKWIVNDSTTRLESLPRKGA